MYTLSNNANPDDMSRFATRHLGHHRLRLECSLVHFKGPSIKIVKMGKTKDKIKIPYKLFAFRVVGCTHRDA